MSRTLSRLLGRSLISPAYIRPAKINDSLRTLLGVQPLQGAFGGCLASYSKRNGPPPDKDEPFKTVNKSRVDDDDDPGLDGDLNWELNWKRTNRFYLPNAIGPAWQGDTSTVGLMEPLEHLVNFFKDENADKSCLEFDCCRCPMLIRNSIYELFPVRAIGQRDQKLTLLTLSYEGDIELGAAKFVLAAKEISDRLLSMGYWADFLNPFSGRPFFLQRDGIMLYKQDYRFRGLNMRLTNHNECVLIAAEENDKTCFSGTIFCTAPNDYGTLVELLAPEELRDRLQKLSISWSNH